MHLVVCLSVQILKNERSSINECDSKSESESEPEYASESESGSSHLAHGSCLERRSGVEVCRWVAVRTKQSQTLNANYLIYICIYIYIHTHTHKCIFEGYCAHTTKSNFEMQTT